MSNEDFDALVDLIHAIGSYSREANAHPSDGPRQERLANDYEDMIQGFRERLVL